MVLSSREKHVSILYLTLDIPSTPFITIDICLVKAERETQRCIYIADMYHKTKIIRQSFFWNKSNSKTLGCRLQCKFMQWIGVLASGLACSKEYEIHIWILGMYIQTKCKGHIWKIGNRKGWWAILCSIGRFESLDYERRGEWKWQTRLNT